MPVGLDQFVKNLTDSGVLSAGKLEHFLPPKASPKSAEELAKELVRQKQLTKYQAAEIYQGRAKSLILGNYTIVDKIGAGGMGQVFKAEHRRMHRIVALKVLPKAVTKDAAAVARFQREVEAAARLNHPNIVTAHDADEAVGVNFLVMEFVEGTDLSALVKKDGPLPVDRAAQCILQAARGLEFAHAEGVVHRDIKPANLLLDKKGTVKILDMGLARIEAGANAATQAELTGTGAVMGTVDYMSPEQALNTKHADARADIYSLGCALHYLLTGKPVYDGDTLTAKLIAHQIQPVPELRQVREDVPPELEAVFQKMVAKKVDDRYQTMSQVVVDLQACVLRESTVVGAATSTDTSPEQSSLSLLKDAAVGAEPRQPTKATKADVPSILSAGNGRHRKLLLIGGGLLAALVVLAGVLLKLRTKDGTLVVEIDQPDADVRVLNEEGKVEITRPGEKGTISISIDPGKHRLKVEKDGFVVFGRDFVMESGGTQSIKATLEEDKPWFRAEFKKWEKETAALPAEDQLQAVRKKMMELNPDFDGRLAEETVSGVVATVSPWNDHLVDISPLRAFAKLKTLRLLPSSHQFITQLADVSPLAGMPLTSLDFSGTKVSDLSPLAGMPLTSLKFDWAPVSDLAPLKGMELTTLSCFNTKVRLLSPLIGMPLKSLICYGTPISDLSPLTGMKLAELHCGSTQVSDLSPLKGIPLAVLDVGETQVSDLSPLTGMPLTFFCCNGTPVSDLSPLKGTKLTTLNIQGTKVSTLLPLMGLPLKSFYCSGTQVSDLSPLKGMQLTELLCSRTGVADLSPLAGMPLSMLQCGHSKATDLKPLRGMPLTNVTLDGTQVADLSPLRGMPLAFLSLGSCSLVSELSPLEGMPLIFLHLGGTKVTPAGVAALKKTLPANCDVRWDEPAAVGNAWELPAFKKWEQEVAAMPAEKQVKAVVKKLQEVNPGFDGKVTGWDGNGTPKVENGVVTELSFLADTVTDIAPVRALADLRRLQCGGPFLGRGKLADLSPLVGMQLTILDCSRTNVYDLSPVTSLPALRELMCAETLVSDLTPLRGMALTGLGCQQTAVVDLWPLKGMSLTEFECHGSKVSDLSPLRGMPLSFLECNDTKVSDLTPLEGMNLTAILFTPKNITEGLNVIRQMKSLKTLQLRWDTGKLAPDEFWKKYDAGEFGTPAPPRKVIATYKDPAFKKWAVEVAALPAEEQVKSVAKKLQELNPGFDGNVTGFNLKGTPTIVDGIVTELGVLTDNVTDLGPVRALVGLKNLDCRGSGAEKGRLSNLSPLKGMRLTGLICGGTQVSDLSPLEGMPLTFVNCGGTAVSDLSPLRGMSLTYLHCDATRVSDLSPLQGMPLGELMCDDTQVSDLSVLKGTELATIGFTPKKIIRGTDVIRQMKSLKTIGLAHNIQFSPQEFWKKYDAGDFK